MKLIIFFVALASAVLANPIKDAKSMTLIKRNADGLEENTMVIRDVNDQLEEVGLVKRKGRHVHHIPGHHGHIGHKGKKIKKGKKGKKMRAMASPAAVTSVDNAAVV